VVVNGQEWSGPLNVVHKAVLGEISFVDLGADGRSSARVAAAKEEKVDKTAEQTKEAKAIAEGEQPRTTVQVARRGADECGSSLAARA
jgi:hypothetical protein